MRHVFILNPAAGKHRSAVSLIPEIEAVFRRVKDAYAIHVTDAPGAATALARQEADKGDPVRLYACGGDGTLLEVFRGMAHAPNAQLACVPCGSGNDFVRMLPRPRRFRSIAAQVAGTPRRLDSLRCNGEPAMNLCSMGMTITLSLLLSSTISSTVPSKPLNGPSVILTASPVT